ncbi:hypothetical protein B0H16DRAFT_1459113 [Mycena metata]|uniref:Uncharacterized protein n=1 Tax=Mycena metata TaxID=1033252 RepID=A0AAD7NC30_9AGAR|nr:hypothetical protein B0H16DRAFT_1459113 [Mycena metata]
MFWLWSQTKKPWLFGLALAFAGFGSSWIWLGPGFIKAKAKAKLISLPKAMASSQAKPKPTIQKAKAKARTSLVSLPPPPPTVQVARQCRAGIVGWRWRIRITLHVRTFIRTIGTPSSGPMHAIGVRALGRITEASGISAMLREPSGIAENSQEYVGTSKKLMEHLIMTQNDW